MFSEEIQMRLKMLEENLVNTSSQQLYLEEKNQEGIAGLQLVLKNPCIAFKHLEDKKLGYFRNKKCADHVLYEYTPEGWIVHIFELKRSVGKSEWSKMKEQFKGAMQNALAISGFLGISVDLKAVRLYSAYRNDKLNDYSNPGRLRYHMYEHGKRIIPDDCADWNEKYIKLNSDKTLFIAFINCYILSSKSPQTLENAKFIASEFALRFSLVLYPFPSCCELS